MNRGGVDYLRDCVVEPLRTIVLSHQGFLFLLEKIIFFYYYSYY